MKQPLIKYRVTEDIPEEVWYKGDILHAQHENIAHALKYYDRIEILECPDEYRGYFKAEEKKPVLELVPEAVVTTAPAPQSHPKKKRRKK